MNDPLSQMAFNMPPGMVGPQFVNQPMHNSYRLASTLYSVINQFSVM